MSKCDHYPSQYGYFYEQCKNCHQHICKHNDKKCNKECSNGCILNSLCKSCFVKNTSIYVLTCGCGQEYCINHQQKEINNTFGEKKICAKCKPLRKLTDKYLVEKLPIFPVVINQLILDYAYNFHHIYRRNPMEEKTIRQQRVKK